MTGFVVCPHCSTRVLPMTGRVCPACTRNVDSSPSPRPIPGADPAVDGFAARPGRGAGPSSGIDGDRDAWRVEAKEDDLFAGAHPHPLMSVARQAEGQKTMLFGALWCAGGLIVTALTYNAAAGQGGGKYVVAWGAIVFGGIQLFRGLNQATKG